MDVYLFPVCAVGWAGLDANNALFGSPDAVSYNPTSDAWTVRAPAPDGAALTQAASDGRYIYVVCAHMLTCGFEY